MRKLIILFFIATLLTKCSNDSKNLENSNQCKYPECFTPSINVILKRPVENPRASIKKYLYNGQNVYIVDDQFASMGNDIPLGLVRNENCETVCDFGGGIAGTKSTCLNWDKAVFIETVWTDPR
ncbi:DUF6970 domain-containing protein [Flavobacterium sp. HJJ]|uniref:DUF6970 domain-containing protein n=1 Tax=Flavobacterium sp. HJJ TaxID=2783792 RepID=UPI00188BF112|nr:hypothetical protein [Flavobacterium sp. HJJ]MBF4470633.1 hypothetical protein [Flavobacterium sp. HJJ]